MTKFEIIQQCVENADWTGYSDKITHQDLMQYILQSTMPVLDDKGHLMTKVETCSCPVCQAKVKPMVFSITSRSVKFLIGMNYLCKKSLSEGKDGYVHYDECIRFVSNYFKHTKGKKMGEGIVYSSYSTLSKEFWELITPRLTTNQKSARDGYFKLSDRGYSFIKCEIAIPDKIWILSNKVIKVSDKKVYANLVPNVNFEECVQIYKTW